MALSFAGYVVMTRMLRGEALGDQPVLHGGRRIRCLTPFMPGCGLCLLARRRPARADRRRRSAGAADLDRAVAHAPVSAVIPALYLHLPAAGACRMGDRRQTPAVPHRAWRTAGHRRGAGLPVVVRDAWRAHRVRRALGEAVTPVSAASLIERLEAAGVQLWFEGGQLRFRAPRGALSAEQRGELAAARDAVLQLCASARLARCDARRRSPTASVRCGWCTRNCRSRRPTTLPSPYSVISAVRYRAPARGAADAQRSPPGAAHHLPVARRPPDPATLPAPRRSCSTSTIAPVPTMLRCSARVQADYRRPFDLARGPGLAHQSLHAFALRTMFC